MECLFGEFKADLIKFGSRPTAVPVESERRGGGLHPAWNRVVVSEVAGPEQALLRALQAGCGVWSEGVLEEWEEKLGYEWKGKT